MKNLFRELFSFAGRLPRGRYVLLGLVLFALKYPIDHVVAAHGFGYSWSPLTYFSVRRGPLLHPAAMPGLWLSLLAVAAPFAAAGLALTVRRLRDAGASPAWSVLFFAPYVNYLFFLVTATLPPRRDAPAAASASAAEADEELAPRSAGAFARLIPRHPLGAFFVALAASASIGIASIVLALHVAQNWGSSLFLITPFSLGFFSALIVGYHEPVSFKFCAGFTSLILLGTEAALFLFGWEGMACLVMATPILIPFALLGAAIAHQINKYRWAILSSLALAIGIIPVSMLIEGEFSPAPCPFVVESTVEIDAPLDLVWRRVIEFPTIDAPPEWIFRLGVAMPERAEIDGGRVGAERRCIFNKGGFTEPIEVWEPRRELTFGVSAQPAGLDRYLDVRRGQFLLRPAGASRTVLEGRTWCELKVYPVFYWLAWSDGIIETIHGRVLRHIRRLAEEDRRRVAAQE